MTPAAVTEALAQTVETCAAALESFSSLPYGHNPNNAEASTLSVIRSDFLSLLALVRAHSTTLSLAFKPPPTYDAASRPLSDLRNDVAKIAGCMQILAASQEGAIFFKHSRSQATIIVDGVRSLVQTFIIAKFDDPVVANNDRTYLLRMGSLHSAIDRCKAALPLDNRAAVLELWAQNSGMIQDALIEYEELSQPHVNGADQNQEDMDDEMDNWDDVLGHEPSKELTAAEAEIAKKCWMIARMVHKLHERIASKHLSSSGPALDSLVESSSSIVESIDDLTVSLYGPQIPTSIESALRELSTALRLLRERLSLVIGVSIPADVSATRNVEDSMKALSLEGAATEPSKDVKWLVSCFSQIDKSIVAVL